MHNVSFSVPLEENSLKRSELLSRSLSRIPQGLTLVSAFSFLPFPWAITALQDLHEYIKQSNTERYTVEVFFTLE